ncbi:MAG TPA: hypothetical protein VEK11_00185 [Thermoanaerobaculia bacterium]|jgi:hypothetical protein|nr:hypothetical protein [Thermoanaerobaculia bacterium]
MEDIRTYGREEDEKWLIPDDERIEWSAASDDEPPYHIPRD